MSLPNARHLDRIIRHRPSRPAVFVETGTFHGKTTRWAVDRFREVHTIELNEQWYEDACRDLAPLGVHCHHGNSADLIPKLAWDIREPVFYFLDAHFFTLVPDVAGESEGLPLWAELEVIAQRPYPDIVAVDDAGLFGTRTPTPEWEHVSLERIAAYFPDVAEAVILGDQACVFRGQM